MVQITQPRERPFLFAGAPHGRPDARRTEPPLVRYVNVDKSYDGLTFAVRGLNLEVQPGEFLTLLGPSGSGKTTCLMMLAGFEAVTGGEIMFAGRDISRVPVHKRGIGMVFQNYALFPHMTVAENLSYPLRVRGVSRTDILERVARALRLVRLEGLGERSPGQLSGGQQQRVAVARALVFEPKLVLMDEPLGALDRRLREELQFEIKHLHEKLGITVLYVTHDQSEALTMSNRIAVFQNGEILQVATPEEIYMNPASLFVAKFLGDCNVVTGELKQRTGERGVVVLPGGGIVHAKVVSAMEPGDSASVAVRPEWISLNPDPSNLANSFTARIEERIFLGDHHRVRVNACGNDDFVVKIPSAATSIGCDVGDIVNIGWAWDRCRAFVGANPSGEPGSEQRMRIAMSEERFPV
jgi:putative spermidine/putrescine transport system ATP-binding protein